MIEARGVKCCRVGLRLQTNSIAFCIKFFYSVGVFLLLFFVINIIALVNINHILRYSVTLLSTVHY